VRLMRVATLTSEYPPGPPKSVRLATRPRRSETLYQIHNPHAQRDVALAPLDLTDVRPVEAGLVGEHVLRPALLLPQRAHLRPDLFLDGLHQEQFGASLFLTILVITSRLA